MSLATTTYPKSALIASVPTIISSAILLLWIWPKLPLAPLDRNNRATVEDRVSQFGHKARERWRPFFSDARVKYPPARITFVGLKEEKLLEVYAELPDGSSRLVRSLPILAASGDLGPKLQQGDGQVPEGLYRIESLNPNSSYHLSLRVNYPNASDRAQANRDGRTQLGGDIMIHGNRVSIGCLAMGDEAAEDLFVLAADVGIARIKVLLSPIDFRRRSLPKEYEDSLKPWVAELYGAIRLEIAKLPKYSNLHKD